MDSGSLTFIHCRQVFCSLFDNRNHDQANEGIGHVALFYDIVYLFNEGDGDDRDKGDADSQRDDRLDHSEAMTAKLLMLVVITLGVGLEDGVVDAMVGSYLENDIDKIGDEEQDGGTTRDFEGLAPEFLRVVAAIKGVEEGCRNS